MEGTDAVAVPLRASPTRAELEGRGAEDAVAVPLRASPTRAELEGRGLERREDIWKEKSLELS
jgi:hypothetical protein